MRSLNYDVYYLQYQEEKNISKCLNFFLDFPGCSRLMLVDYNISQDHTLGWSKNPLSSQTDKLMAGTKFSDYLGLNHCKKSKQIKTFHSFRLGLLASKFKYIP